MLFAGSPHFLHSLAVQVSLEQGGARLGALLPLRWLLHRAAAFWSPGNAVWRQKTHSPGAPGLLGGAAGNTRGSFRRTRVAVRDQGSGWSEFGGLKVDSDS